LHFCQSSPLTWDKLPPALDASPVRYVSPKPRPDHPLGLHFPLGCRLFVFYFGELQDAAAALISPLKNDFSKSTINPVNGIFGLNRTYFDLRTVRRLDAPKHPTHLGCAQPPPPL
jgi:hypothetical protein